MHLDSYFAALHKRRSEAKILRYRAVSAPGWTPDLNRCHSNVDYWIALNPHLKAVRGWLIRACGCGDSCNYAAHSVFEEDGKLYDITLNSQAECDHFPFLEHAGTPEQFNMIRVYGPAEQWWPPCSLDLLGADESEDAEDIDY